MKLIIGLTFLALLLAQEIPKESDSQADQLSALEIEKKKRDDLLKEKDNLHTLLKTLHYSCIVLTRFQLSTYGSNLMELLQQYQKPEEQNTLWKKVYTTHVLKCQKTITYDDSVKIFTEIKANSFDFTQYSYVFDDITLENFRNQPIENITLTDEDLKTWKYIEDFEQSMKEKQKEQDEEDDLITRAKKIQSKIDLEPKIFGVEIRFGRFTQIMVLLVITSGMAVLFWKVYQMINASEQPKKKKQKKRD